MWAWQCLQKWIIFWGYMFLDMVKWNTLLNSISMLKSSVSCHWNGWNSEGCAPGYRDGIVRVLPIFGYTFCSAPFLWASLWGWWTHCRRCLGGIHYSPGLANWHRILNSASCTDYFMHGFEMLHQHMDNWSGSANSWFTLTVSLRHSAVLILMYKHSLQQPRLMQIQER